MQFVKYFKSNLISVAVVITVCFFCVVNCAFAGSILGWGSNYFGEATPPAGNNYVAISAGWGHSLALRSDGSIVGWGWDLYGQTYPPPAWNDYIAISAGKEHGLALRSDGSIVGWGYPWDGRRIPPPGNNYIAISAGGTHSLALKSDGSIVGWGFNWSGQASSPSGNDFVAVAAGESHSLALKSDGSIVAWGYNYNGQATPPTGNEYIAISAGRSHNLALRAILRETSSIESSLFEALSSQQAVLENGSASGDLTGTINFSSFEIVSIKTGPFAGKGFSKAHCQAMLESVSYEGIWQGFLFLKPHERKIYLKGSTSGEMAATVEGYLTESLPDSSVYDQYEATWKIGRLGNTTTSATIHLKGILSYQSSSEFPNTPLYILQSSIEGTVSGHYADSLSSVVNHIRIADATNPYFGEGFSIISYVSESGQGEGWTYDRQVSPGVVEMKGLFDSPLFGIASGTLHETKTPRTLFATIERVDLGLPPMADLEVQIWGPTRVSPGQTIDYIIEYRNDGRMPGQDVYLVQQLSPLVEFVGATEGFYYSPISHELSWNLGTIPAKTSALLSVRGRVQWGLPWGTSIVAPTYIGQAKNFKSIYFPGINWGDPCFPAITDLAREFGARPVPTYKDTGLDWLHKFDALIEVYKAYLHIPTEKNGLNWSYGCYDVAIAHSGGTRTLISLIQTARITVDTVVLLSPQLISQQELEDIVNGHLAGVKRIIVYQSDADYCFYVVQEENYGVWTTSWVNVNDTSQAYVLPTALFYVNGVPIEDSVFVGRDRETGQFLHSAPGVECPAIWHGVPHDKMPFYLKGLLVGGQLDWAQPPMPDDTSGFGSTVAAARDPSVKYGREGNVAAGQRLDYRVEYENEGQGIAFGVYFTDTLDQDLDDSALQIGPVIDVKTGAQIAPSGTYNPATRTITWFVGEVGPGEGGIAAFDINVRHDAEDGTEIINYATIYFPSVPEVTRTNGIVSIVSLVKQVGLDIYPNRTPNQVYLSKNYTLYVVVLGSASFNVSTVDSSTVKFGRSGSEAKPVRAPTMRDLNADGFTDAMYGFMTFNCGFQLGDTEGVLTGKTTAGINVIGRDSVLVLP